MLNLEKERKKITVLPRFCNPVKPPCFSCDSSDDSN